MGKRGQWGGDTRIFELLIPILLIESTRAHWLKTTTGLAIEQISLQ